MKQNTTKKTHVFCVEQQQVVATRGFAPSFLAIPRPIGSLALSRVKAYLSHPKCLFGLCVFCLLVFGVSTQDT